MSPETRQRLLAYAQELVDQKVQERTYLAGDRTIINDRLVSLQIGQPPPPEEPEDIWTRVWAIFTYSQVAVSDLEDVPFPTKSFVSDPFPVFTLRPGSQALLRKNQLDQMEYFLDNASVYSSPTTLLYPNSSAPLVLAQNLSSWSQASFPPYYPVYPGFFYSDSEMLAPFRVGGPYEIFEDSSLVETLTVSATVTLFVKGHLEETLDDFALGGQVRRTKLTVRQVGSQDVGGADTPLVQLQDANVDFTGETFTFNPISTDYIGIDETVSLVGFELL